MRTKIVSQTKKYNSSSTQIIISLDIFQNRIIFPMHTLRLYTATVWSFISIGAFVKEDLNLREIWTDWQTG